MADLAGLRLAITTFTVLPVRAGRVDRAAAGTAMALAPLVGAGIGLVLGGVLLGLRALHAPALVAGGVTVAVGALLSRGLHLDGLADTVDGLGSYERGGAALEIMRKPDVGPFGVAALVLCLMIQVGALAAVSARGWPAVLLAAVAGTATGRLAASWACRRGVPAARPDGLGALVAGTLSWPVPAVATLVVGAAAAGATPGRPWQGPAAVLVALAAALALVAHAVRRFGGVTGDVLGAAVEAAATAAFAGLSLGD